MRLSQRLLCSILFVIGVGLTPLFAQVNDLYWISFSSDSITDPIFLMQIDLSGKITIEPASIITADRLGGERAASAISKRGARKLNLLVWGEDEIYYRVTVNKANRAILNVKKVSTLEVDDDDFLQVTNKPTGNFALVENPVGRLQLIPLTKKGIPTGTPIEIATTTPNINDEASISSDGSVVLTIRNTANDPTPPRDRVYALLLDSAGKLLIQKKLAAVRDIDAVDVTNLLSSGNRFAVYVVDSPDKVVFLQVLDPSLRKVGPPIVINNIDGREVDEQNVAIDPLGRFVIFTVSGERFNCPDQDVIVYQKLELTGQPTGDLKLIAGCGLVTENIMNIDLLKD